MESKTPIPSELGCVHGQVREHYRGCMTFYQAAANRAPTMIWVEFGVHIGTSAKKLLKLLDDDGRLHLFDSLKGLPEPWQIEKRSLNFSKANSWSRPFSYKAGMWSGPAYEFNDRRTLYHIGLFSNTLPFDFEDQLGLVHFDADLYSSTRDALAGIKPYIKPGTVLIFDELIEEDSVNTNWREGEWKALVESGIEIEWFARATYAMAGVVTAMPGPRGPHKTERKK